MNQIDNDFFDAYKHLDKLCGEIYDCRNGISEYITQMEHLPRGHWLVSNWDSDYKKLKHIRWVRNQIAHESSSYAISDEADIEFAELFYIRIMNQDDPFSRLRKIEQARTQRSFSINGDTIYLNVNSASTPPSKPPIKKKGENTLVVVLTYLFVIILLMLLLYYFIR